jgi:hypothetical protein
VTYKIQVFKQAVKYYSKLISIPDSRETACSLSAMSHQLSSLQASVKDKDLTPKQPNNPSKIIGRLA